MKLISHRGNTVGKNPEYENNPLYVEETLLQGYGCEIDLWFNDGSFYLGHKEPQYEISYDWLEKTRDLYVHCKNIEALSAVSGSNICYFFHQRDDYTLTSHGHLWAFPGKEVPPNTPKSVCLMPEYNGNSTFGYWGVCSDRIKYHRN